MKQILSFVILLLFPSLMVQANDAVYYASGSFLFPTRETDISVSKEILTITLQKGDYASVDVYYEFANPGEAKTVLMAFDAGTTYNVFAPFNRSGVHPFIKDFTVTMNGRHIAHRNAVIAEPNDGGKSDTQWDYTKLDVNDWKAYGEVSEEKLPIDGYLYNPRLDSTISYSYAYFFDAPFREGKNVVHHTYRYHFSQYVMTNQFELPYCLVPAIRWANGQIDDFTLRIIDRRGDGFCLIDSVFSSAPFRAVEGECWHLTDVYYNDQYKYDESLLLASENATLEWHARNFKPTDNLVMWGGDYVRTAGLMRAYSNQGWVVEDDHHKLVGNYLGTCGDDYLVEVQDYGLVPRKGHSLVYYRAKDGRGWLVIDASRYKAVNLRQQPSNKSSVVGTITCDGDGIPEAYPCLGRVADLDRSLFYKYWYRVRVGNKTGYVNASLMLWRPFF